MSQQYSEDIIASDMADVFFKVHHITKRNLPRAVMMALIKVAYQRAKNIKLSVDVVIGTMLSMYLADYPDMATPETLRKIVRSADIVIAQHKARIREQQEEQERNEQRSQDLI